MSNTAYFHFTLGPVQSFVAQARRTRDFWAGSFILSWLSGVAMREVIAQCGNDKAAILFPRPEATFLDWLDGTKRGKQGCPEQGSIPNRFKAAVNKETFKPAEVVSAVQTGWKALADVVFDKDFDKLEFSRRPDRNLWNRQIEACWEMVWAITDDITDSALLDQRKNWRSHPLPEEPGVKCMMMDGWQELSSTVTPDESALEAFWKRLRESSATLQSDLREKERLCAIAFVKRRFPRHFQHLQNVPMPGKWRLHGWEVDAGRPSVSYMAAVHWLEKVILHANESEQVEKLMQTFHQSARRLTEEYGEWGNGIRCIQDALDKKPRSKEDRKWRAINGDVFFTSVLENTDQYPTPAKKQQAADTLRQLKRLQGVFGIGAASPFYAVLMMDGDNLGEQMKEACKQEPIAEGLQQFTARVSGTCDEQGLVYKHNGFLVYAGGDDVLAVLPTENALACALDIRECYRSIFEPYKSIGLTTSISAAIEFVHIRMPLTKLLRDANSLLKNVAKQACGRDSLAVRVWKPGGKALEWAMPWHEACAEIGGTKQLVLDRLAKDLKAYQREYDPQGQFSSKFFYKIRERLELFNPPDGDETASSPLKSEHAVDLMAAEYVSSGLSDKAVEKGKRLEYAKAVVRPLLKQCYPLQRIADDPQNIRFESPQNMYRADGALLVRFLAQKEVV